MTRRRAAQALRVCVLWLLLPPALGRAAPQVSAPIEFPSVSIDARPPLAPAVAFDGDDTFLVVWQQGRRVYQSESGDIYAMRVKASTGQLLDGQPLALCKAAGTQERPRVTFAAGRFFVVWQDYRNGKDWDVYAARVGVDGSLPDVDGFAVATAVRSQARPDVVAIASGAMIVWQDHRGARYELYAARVADDGVVAEPDGVALVSQGAPLVGGLEQVAGTASGPLLLYRNEHVWPKAPLSLARLSDTAAPTVLQTAVTVNGLYGVFAGRIAAEGSRALISSGGAQRSTRIAVAMLYDTATLAPQPNPNTEQAAGASGWDPTYAISLRYPLVPGSRPPFALGVSAGQFLALTVDNTDAQSLDGVRIDAKGLRLDLADAPLSIEKGTARLAAPAVAGGKAKRYLVVYERYEAGGQRTLRARIVSE